MALSLSLTGAALAACTPEATVVPASGGAGGSGTGSGGSTSGGSTGTSGGSSGAASGGTTSDGGSGGEDVCGGCTGTLCCDEGPCLGDCVEDCREGVPCPDGSTCGERGFCVPSGGGAGGTGGSGGGGTGGTGQQVCDEIEAPLSSCESCMESVCATELADCADNDCACGSWGNEIGQMNCLLSCSEWRPDPPSISTCAADCGFTDLDMSHPATKALVDCLAEGAGPGMPPDCAPCFLPP